MKIRKNVATIVGSLAVVTAGCSDSARVGLNDSDDLALVAVVETEAASIETESQGGAAPNDTLPSITAPVNALPGRLGWSFEVVTDAGWEYEIQISLSGAPHFEVDTTTSPPGQAKIAVTRNVRFDWQAVSLVPDRTAPDLDIWASEVFIVYKLPSALLSEIEISLTALQDVGCRLYGDRKVLECNLSYRETAKEPDADMNDGEFRGAMQGWHEAVDVRHTSVDVSETSAIELVDFLQSVDFSTGDPTLGDFTAIIRWGLGAIGDVAVGCKVQLVPDGEVEVLLRNCTVG